MTDGAALLTTFQIHVANIFFGLKASRGYVVAGGAALLASELIDRPTQDIDLFASAPTVSVAEARAALVRALDYRGHTTELIHDSPTFCRLIVRDNGYEVLVDLAIDSPPIAPPTVTLLGPTLVPLDLAGRKLLALFGRAEARDFVDVYVLAERFGKRALIKQAEAMDTGFALGVLAQMMGTVARFADDELPLRNDDAAALRGFFDSWAAEITRGSS